jgi:uncharacterized protein
MSASVSTIPPMPPPPPRLLDSRSRGSMQGCLEYKHYYVDSRDKEHKHTPLAMAANCGDEEMVKILVSRGADVNATDDEDGTSVLYTATDMGHIKIAEFLISAGADVNQDGGYDNIPLHIAVYHNMGEMVELLLKNGSNVNAIAGGGFATSLHSACICGYANIVKILLRYGADPTILDNDEETPLDYAINQGYDDIAALLVRSWPPLKKRGQFSSRLSVAELSNKQIDGMSLLHIASEKGLMETVSLLLQSGAKVNLPNSNEETPLDLALSKGYIHIPRLLREYGGVARQRIDPKEEKLQRDEYDFTETS